MFLAGDTLSCSLWLWWPHGQWPLWEVGRLACLLVGLREVPILGPSLPLDLKGSVPRAVQMESRYPRLAGRLPRGGAGAWEGCALRDRVTRSGSRAEVSTGVTGLELRGGQEGAGPGFLLMARLRTAALFGPRCKCLFQNFFPKLL